MRKEHRKGISLHVRQVNHDNFIYVYGVYMPLSVNEIFFNKHILSVVDGLDDDVLDVMILCNRRKYKS
mgnify:CR=1 FL=1